MESCGVFYSTHSLLDDLCTGKLHTFVYSSLKLLVVKKLGSSYFSGKLPTYPSPKPTLTFTSHILQNVGLGKG